MNLITNTKVWLSDFVPYSTESWIGLLGDYNSDFWPYNLLAAALLIILIWTHRQNRTHYSRVVLVILALCWIWISIIFHRQYYLTLNWSAMIFVWMFLVQALLLLFWPLSGVATKSATAVAAGKLSTAGLILAALSQPLLQLLSGHSYTTLGWPGLTPDATVVLTVFLVSNQIRFCLPLLVIPTLWSIYEFATGWPMDYLPGMSLFPLCVLMFVLGRYYSHLYRT